MPQHSVEKIISLLSCKQNIRNICVGGSVDHGVSTIIDLLVDNAAITTQQMDKKTIGTVVPLYYKLPSTDQEVNSQPLSSQSSVTSSSSFSPSSSTPTERSSSSSPTTTQEQTTHQISEGKKEIDINDNSVTSSSFLSSLPPSLSDEYWINIIKDNRESREGFRVSDGFVLVVDCVEGFPNVQAETLLREALMSGLKPILVINKIDRLIRELTLTAKEMYEIVFVKIIESVNIIIQTYADTRIGSATVSPEAGTVLFCSGHSKTGFTVSQFARLYSKKFGLSIEKLTERLWGDHYFDTKTKKWVTTEKTSDGRTLERGFCLFILNPILQVFQACQTLALPRLTSICQTLHVEITPNEIQEKDGWKLFKSIMARWLPLTPTLLSAFIRHLPSPIVTQRNKVESLYLGSLEDSTAMGIKRCDSEGPLLVYVWRMVPTAERGRFFAVARVFSGTLKASQKIHIYGAQYVTGRNSDLFVDRNIKGLYVPFGPYLQAVDSVGAGCICMIEGVDQYIVKTATIVADRASLPLITLKETKPHTISATLSPKDAENLVALSNAMRILSKSDAAVSITQDATGDYVIHCMSELHLELTLQDIREWMKPAELVVREPLTELRETVTTQSPACMTKSPNKRNKLTVTAQPLLESLTNAMETNVLYSIMSSAERRGEILHQHFPDFDPGSARNIWAFAPNNNGPNVIIDSTKGISTLSEVRDSILAALEWNTKEGILCEEPLRGVRFDIKDATLDVDPVRRGAGQIIPCARRALIAAQLTAQPRLMEPVYLVSIISPPSSYQGIYSVLSQRHGEIIESIDHPYSSLIATKAYLPVLESRGNFCSFSSELRAATSGQAFPQYAFDHWKIIDGDPTQPGNRAYDLVRERRTRKGLRPDIPSAEDYMDNP